MKRAFRLLVFAAPIAAMAGSMLLVDARASLAKPEYTRRTKKECQYCHPPNSFQLTDAGRYYRDHRTLDGYDPNVRSK
jgi:hypothetical protein